MTGRARSQGDYHAQLLDRAAVVKARVPIEDVIGKVVSLKKIGNNFAGLCPFHGEHTPSFTVNPKKQFFHCFGCGANGDLLNFVQRKQDITFRDALELLESQNGLKHIAATPATPPPKPVVPQAEDKQRLKRSLDMWAASTALTPESPVTLYLLGRDIIRPADYGVGDRAINDGWPVDLRFMANCWHDFERKPFPAMVAPIRGYDGAILTLHRTYLARRGDGSWGKAAVAKTKLVVGSFGPGYIRLGESSDKMLGGEGIETTLSAGQLWKRPGLCFVTAGRMGNIDLPFLCSDFIYAADKGGKGEWGERFAQRGAIEQGQARTVAVRRPRLDADKGDFNDFVRLQANAVRAGVSQ